MKTCNNLSKADSMMIELVRSSLNGGEIKGFIDVDWGLVYKNMIHQSVATMPTMRIRNLPGISIDIAQEWRKHIISNVVHFCSLCSEQEELLSILEANGIRCVVLKGTSAAIYYSAPQQRSYGDVDILIEEENFCHAVDILTRFGYRKVGEIERHISFQKNGIEFEIHRIWNKEDGDWCPVEIAKGINEYIWQGFDDIQKIRFQDGLTHVLPWQQNGIVLLDHMNHHLVTGLGLRHVIDWIMFVIAKVDDNTWQYEFGPICHRFHLDILAKAITKMSQRWFDLPVGITWANDVKDDICDELMAKIIQQGSFGRLESDTDEGKSINLIRQATSIKELWRILQKSGEATWLMYKRHQWLRPFAWIYEALYVITKGLQMRNPIKKFIHNNKIVRRRNKLVRVLRRM